MANDPMPWEPDWAVAPGEVLADALAERNMSQSELARRMDRPVKTINEIVNAKAAITPDTALQIERALGISARFWNNLEVEFRAHLARLRADTEMEEAEPWAADFPFADLAAFGAVPPASTKSRKAEAILSFFGVSSTTAWEREWLAPAASFRASPAFQANPKAVAAWLRWGEVEAQTIETAPFDESTFRAAVRSARGLTRSEPISAVLEEIREIFAAAGVALVLTPELKGTHLSGAARWLSPRRALIQISLRHKADDQLWFSLFHESGHVLSGDRVDSLDLDSDENAEAPAELAADSFARDELVSPSDWAEFVAAGAMTEARVRAFARDQGIAAGIIVGRLQREDVIPRNRMNNLKRKLDWPSAR